MGMRSRFVTCGYIGAIFVFVGAQTNFPAKTIPVITLFAIAVVIGTWWWFGKLILRCSTHLADIERRINNLAGEELLTWEKGVPDRSFFHL